ncbi:MAG: glycerate kinase [Thermoanaerobaculia bacterium]
MRHSLTDIYLESLRRVDPAARIAERWIREPHRGPAILLGKCARRMAEGLARAGWSDRGLVVVPRGYEGDGDWPPGFEVHLGSHPMMDEASFNAGDSLFAFASALERPALVLISGGSSACVEKPVDGISAEDLAEINHHLVRAGIPIDQINAVRKHLSSIKGGRLAHLLPTGSRSWIWSDVPPGRADLVGSGPMSADPSSLEEAAAILDTIGSGIAREVAQRLRSGAIPETPSTMDAEPELLADNRTLLEAATAVARERGIGTTVDFSQLDDDVETVAGRIVFEIERLEPGTLAIRGGEPTVSVRGEGRGGRCSELALRALRLAEARGLASFEVLVGSSDGIDGNSGAAGYLVRAGVGLREKIDRALAVSDAHTLAAEAGAAIFTGATGNNLRDIIVMARG